MARTINRGLWEQWRERMRRREDWEGSVVEFCRREGVSQAAFYQWRKKLQTGTGARQIAGTGSQPAFVPVTPVPRNPQSGGPQCADVVVVTLANDVRVEIPAAAPALVERVVRLAAGPTGSAAEGRG